MTAFDCRPVHVGLLAATAGVCLSLVACTREQPTPKDETEKQTAVALKQLGATIELNKDGTVSLVNLRKVADLQGALQQLATLKHVKIVDLGRTEIDDDGLAYLEGLTSLKELQLVGTNITDDGLKHIEGLKSLRWLCIDKTDVTDAGLVHLEKLSNLRVVGLDGDRISLEAVQRLRRFLPPDAATYRVTHTGKYPLRSSKTRRQN